MSRRRDRPPDQGGWDDLDYEDTIPVHKARPTAAELEEGERRLLLMWSPRHRPGTVGTSRCEDCEGWFEKLTLIRSRGWRGRVCEECRWEGVQWSPPGDVEVIEEED